MRVQGLVGSYNLEQSKLLNKSHKLDPWPLDGRSKTKKGLKRELMIWRTKMQPKVQGEV
jgi:hypothetical protein